MAAKAIVVKSTTLITYYKFLYCSRQLFQPCRWNFLFHVS